MCGIFGIIAKTGEEYSNTFILNTIKKLAILSESRGKDSSGLAIRNGHLQKISIFKGTIPVSELLKEKSYLDECEAILECTDKNNNKDVNTSFACIGHARLVTNGTQLSYNNNQPVIKDGVVGIHNGIIVNHNELWGKNKDIQRKFDIDTEVMLSMVRKNLTKGLSTVSSVSAVINNIYGTVATALLFNDRDELVLTTNNGSLYILTNYIDLLVFASEKWFLNQLLHHNSILNKSKNKFQIFQVSVNKGYIIKINEFKVDEFSISKSVNDLPHSDILDVKYKIEEKAIEGRKNGQFTAIIDIDKYRTNKSFTREYDLLEYNWDKINNLKRCSKCLLPETFPFIEFDDKGVCNYCNNYVIKNQPKPIEELIELIEPYKSKNGSPDCIVPFSGGRDSTYTLHLVKTVLNLNPIAFTYDWGMVTDLARRNVARVCGKLGVENIIVSANIRWKRENIRKNIEAWLKYPQLGMIPLFMAGDKFFFYYTNQVKKQTGIDLNIWGINYLENTDFKTGFAGLKPNFEKKRIYSLSLKNHIKLFGFIMKNLMYSPRYFNQSVLDSLGSFASRYIAPKKDYYHLFDYYKWDEDEIEDLIKNEYKWETAIDTKSTWRIGDGTASFYNYIYFTVAGFSEIDTFRSNQVREGMITREQALKLIEEENKARYDSLKWYLEIVELDYERVIKIINNIPKLY